MGHQYEATYDQEANALAIRVGPGRRADRAEQLTDRTIVATTKSGKPIEIEVLYPDLGIITPLIAVTERYPDLDLDTLELAIRSAIARPGKPVKVEMLSGKFNVRIPKTLHSQLVEQAAEEGVSLNQFVSSTLAGAVGWRR